MLSVTDVFKRHSYHNLFFNFALEGESSEHLLFLFMQRYFNLVFCKVSCQLVTNQRPTNELAFVLAN